MAAPAFTEAMTVPVEVIPVMATLYVVPLPVTIAVLLPPAVPVIVTPLPENPVTVLLKTTVKLIGLVLVGSACPIAWSIVTLGPPNFTQPGGAQGGGVGAKPG